MSIEDKELARFILTGPKGEPCRLSVLGENGFAHYHLIGLNGTGFSVADLFPVNEVGRLFLPDCLRGMSTDQLIEEIQDVLNEEAECTIRDIQKRPRSEHNAEEARCAWEEARSVLTKAGFDADSVESALAYLQMGSADGEDQHREQTGLEAELEASFAVTAVDAESGAPVTSVAAMPEDGKESSEAGDEGPPNASVAS